MAARGKSFRSTLLIRFGLQISAQALSNAFFDLRYQPAVVEPDMCGICGSVSLSRLSEPEVTRQHIAAMLQSMAHRGPDDVGIITSASAVLGVTRLAIRGLA